MPIRFCLATSLILSFAACAPAMPEPAAPPRPPVITVRATSPEQCEADWNGEPARAAVIRERAAAAIMANAVQNGPVPPYAIVESAAETRFACAWIAAAVLQEGGYDRIAYRLPGNGTQLAQSVDLFRDRQPVDPLVMVELADNGRMTWNGEEIDLAGIRDRARRFPRRISGPQDIIVAIASADYSFGTVYEVVRALRDAGLEVTSGVPSRSSPGWQRR